jgi:hypothetical protein
LLRRKLENMKKILRRASEIEAKFHVPVDVRPAYQQRDNPIKYFVCSEETVPNEDERPWDFGLGEEFEREDEKGNKDGSVGRYYVRKLAGWRESCKSFDQLSTKLPSFLVDGLVPKKCLTAITGHSFNSKSWLAMQLAWSLSQGESVFGHFGVTEPVPVVYHVPEMNEAMVRHYLNTIGAKNTENFLVRTMENGVWSLDSVEMLASSEGRAVFLDTSGFFNPGDNGNDYKQALKFGELVFNLLNVGALGVTMLGHLTKPMQNKKGLVIESDWTLENSLIGSSGYGAVLRSLLRMKNLNADLNDHNVHLYVQGMKNPGLKPFQLKGPAPLKMFVEPGQSPYLKQLLSGDAQYDEASVLFEQKISQRKIAAQLGLSLGKINKMHQEWKTTFDSDKENSNDRS